MKCVFIHRAKVWQWTMKGKLNGERGREDMRNNLVSMVTNQIENEKESEEEKNISNTNEPFST